MSTIGSTSRGGKTEHWNRFTGVLMEFSHLGDIQMPSGQNLGQFALDNLT